MPKIVVLGGGESGCGAAVLARVKGFDVFLSDMGVIAPKYKALLAEWNVPYEEGGLGDVYKRQPAFPTRRR